MAAFIDRGEIRDSYDIEFLLRKGIELPSMDTVELDKCIRRLDRFIDIDFKVKLGSILESDARDYYTSQKFDYLKENYLKGSRNFKGEFILSWPKEIPSGTSLR